LSDIVILMPCPFCGEQPRFRNPPDSSEFAIECVCEPNPIVKGLKDDISWGIEKWNTRVSRA
jgi:hypothetical protein